MLSLYRVKTLSLKYIDTQVEDTKDIETAKEKSQTYWSWADDGIRCYVIFDIECWEIREYCKKSPCKNLCTNTLSLKGIVQYNISTMPDNIRCNRHEHSNHRGYPSREKKYQRKHDLELNPYANNSHEEEHIRIESLQQKYTEKYNHLHKNNWRYNKWKTREFPKDNHPPSDWLREHQIYGPSLYLTSYHPSSEE